MCEKAYKQPPIVWLKVTDYMHGWLAHELAGAARIGDKRVICTHHLEGARKIFRMESMEDLMDPGLVGKAMSATRKNCISLGLTLDRDVMQKLYGVTEEDLKLYVPIECPRECMTANGVLRRWTNDVCFSKGQVKEMLELLRQAFWDAVGEFAKKYAKEHEGKKYAQVEMIEAFCAETGTSEVYVQAMRREWQRRVKRQSNVFKDIITY